MRRRTWISAGLLAALAAGVLWVVVEKASLSALSDPGPVETSVATAAQRWLVSRSARGPLPPAPPNDAASIANGQMQFGARCAFCHGQDGRSPTDVGRALYPRTLNLSLPAVQGYSDAELFVVIKDGIRLTGMPGFGRIHSDEEIWHLVHYVRNLGAPPKS